MATLPVAPPSLADRYSSSAAASPTPSANLGTGQTGNTSTTNIADRGGDRGPAVVRITSTVGATPTVTVAIEGSMDAAAWYPVAYSDTPISALSVSTFTITTAGVTRKFLPTGHAWRFLRVTYSANTNVTLTTDLLV